MLFRHRLGAMSVDAVRTPDELLEGLPDYEGGITYSISSPSSSALIASFS